MDCVLCSVLEQEKDRIIYEDDSVFVCMNYAPLKPGHMMVLPKRHAERINDLTAEEAVAYNQAIETAMQTLKAWSGSEVLMTLNGWDYRSQPHLHVQITPAVDNIRYYMHFTDGDPRNVIHPPEKLAKVASQLMIYYREIDENQNA